MGLREPLVQAFWGLNLYPEAAEAGGSLRLTSRRTAGGYGGGDPDRASGEAARRARSKVRRYTVANRLNRHGTLTYADACFDGEQVRADVAAFFRGLRPALGGEPFPYVWVPEWHPGGHGLHLHFALGRYVPQPLIRGVWERGHVYIKLIGDLPVGSGALEESRISAGYLCKYIGKGFEDERRPAGLHRYDLAQGFQPGRETFTGTSVEDVLGQASTRMGCEPQTVWLSSDVEDWHGPPACWASWPER